MSCDSASTSANNGSVSSRLDFPFARRPMRYIAFCCSMSWHNMVCFRAGLYPGGASDSGSVDLLIRRQKRSARFYIAKHVRNRIRTPEKAANATENAGVRLQRTTTLWHRLCGVYSGVGRVTGGDQGHVLRAAVLPSSQDSCRVF